MSLIPFKGFSEVIKNFTHNVRTLMLFDWWAFRMSRLYSERRLKRVNTENVDQLSCSDSHRGVRRCLARSTHGD